MKIKDWVDTSTVVLALEDKEITENQIMAPWGYPVFPVRLTLVWTRRPTTDWVTSWTVEASRRTGDLVNLTEADVDEVPAWITREINEYHPDNYSG
jgi:hypothetical protein